MGFELIFFFFFAILAIGSALFMITRRNPVKGVLFMILNFFCLSIFYLMLRAQFLAIVQILVYAGAIMVLFLFVIMLLNLGNESQLTENRKFKKFIAIVFSIFVLMELVIGIGQPLDLRSMTIDHPTKPIGTVEYIGNVLFSEYLFPFEVISMVLLAAMVGVVVLAKKRSK